MPTASTAFSHILIEASALTDGHPDQIAKAA
jgi:hypothetical protein